MNKSYIAKQLEEFDEKFRPYAKPGVKVSPEMLEYAKYFGADDIKAFITQSLEGLVISLLEDIPYLIYQLDWIQILNKAIKSRPLSWYDPAVREWRNASDEVCSALVSELKSQLKKKYL